MFLQNQSIVPIWKIDGVRFISTSIAFGIIFSLKRNYAVCGIEKGTDFSIRVKSPTVALQAVGFLLKPFESIALPILMVYARFLIQIRLRV